MVKVMTKTLYPQQDLADRLKEALENSGLTQAELARSCNVTDQAVHNWVLTGRIDKRHLPKICEVTKHPYEYFLVGLKTWRRVAVIALPFLSLVPLFVALLDAVQGVPCVLCKKTRRLYPSVG